MYLRDLWASLLRRWYLVVLALVVVAGLGVLTYRVVPLTYEARANVLFLPPQDTVGEGGNPFLALSGLDQPAEVVARTLDASAARRDILGQDRNRDYTIERDSSTNSPILLIWAEGRTPDGALGTVDQLLEAVPETLDRLQDELQVPTQAEVSTVTLTVDAEAEVIAKNRIRAVVAVVAVSAGGLMVLIGLVDALLSSRVARRTRVAGRPEAAASHVSPQHDNSTVGHLDVPGAMTPPAGPDSAVLERDRRDRTSSSTSR